jgi:hypothetical protein
VNSYFDRDDRSRRACNLPLEIIFNEPPLAHDRVALAPALILARSAAILRAIADLGPIGIAVVKMVLDVASEERHGQAKIIRDAAGFLDLKAYQALALRRADQVVVAALMRGLRRIEPGEQGKHAA